MARTRTTLGLVALSVVYHALFLGSIFDIYFRSPVVPVSTRYSVQPATSSPSSSGGERLAKRVVLIVGDGLRADKLFQLYPDPPFPHEDPLPRTVVEHRRQQNSIVTFAGEEEVARMTTPAPFLRGLIDSGEAQWGISHTRVPTESRPGHVALLAGMYEDVSAVTRGWTTNPVSFDSVLNQSTHGFTFGSPDILPMFSRGASDPDKVREWSYDEDAEDFTKDATALDLFVVDQLETLFKNASSTTASSSSLRDDLNEPGVVFFLHLLGLDTTGHSYRPHGPEYHRNIRVVDHVVERTVSLVEEFYGHDRDTAYVFTADHGMSSLGNHGDGHPDNTRTPLVVWGKGVRTRHEEDWEEPANQDEYSIGWRLGGVRRDVDQADVAPLLSTLAGLAIPANSAGRVPLEYLDGSASFRARAAFANANQLLAEAEAKAELKRQHTVSFRPFRELVDATGPAAAGTRSPESHREFVRDLIRQHRYLEAEQHCVELLDVALRASAYFQKYDWFLLRSIVTLGYIGFMLYVSKYIVANHVVPPPPHSPAEDVASSKPRARRPGTVVAKQIPLVAFIVTTTRFVVERAPVTYSLYTFCAFYFWHDLFRDPTPFVRLYQHHFVLPSSSASASLASKEKEEASSRTSSPPSSSPHDIDPVSRNIRSLRDIILETAAYAFVTVVSLEAIAYGYSDRRAFAVVALAMGWLWPLERHHYRIRVPGSASTSRGRGGRHVLTSWRGSMTVLAVFPLLPVEKGEDLRVISAGAVLMLILGSVALREIGKNPLAESKRAYRFVLAQLGLVVASNLVTCASATSLRLKKGLPRLNQYLGWIILVASIALPFWHGRPRGQSPSTRLSVLVASFAPAFVILSLSYEALFYCVFCGALLSWLAIESSVSRKTNKDDRAKQEERDGTVDEDEWGVRDKGLQGPEGGGKVKLDTVRVSVFFLSFLHLGFFGVGNVASISSFYLEPVYRLMTVFAPFPMGALLLFKLLIPFVALSAVSSAINQTLRLPHLGLFLVSSVLVEFLTITFFFRVTDTGSWLEIGSSITNFVICSMLGLFTSILLVVGESVLKDTTSV